MHHGRALRQRRRRSRNISFLCGNEAGPGDARAARDGQPKIAMDGCRTLPVVGPGSVGGGFGIRKVTARSTSDLNVSVGDAAGGPRTAIDEYDEAVNVWMRGSRHLDVV